MEKKYFLITYGCQMNVHESEKLAGILRKNDYISTDIEEDADIIVLNTCCIRESAETRILGNLGFIKTIKEKKPDLKVVVCGCMAQADGAADKLKKRCPFINLIFGTHNIHEFNKYLLSISQSNKTRIEIWDKELPIVENLPIYRTSGVNAWVNIMYGCNNFCSYCIVPYVRGRERSRNIQNIIDDVKKLISEGYSEITLLGQNVNSYGNDFTDKKINFPMLLDKIASLEGEFRLKFLTSHPKDLSEDVVKVIASSNKLANYIHLPIQSGSDKILGLMNRKYTTSEYLNKIDMIRNYIPDAGISSDIMVGFPDESEKDFLDTMALVEKVKYNSLYTFIYSKRNKTPAAKMLNQIDIAIKRDRIKRLINLQFEIANKQAQKTIGNVYNTLCFENKGKYLIGKTTCDRAVYFNGNDDLIGKFVNVKITGVKNTKLYGTIIENN